MDVYAQALKVLAGCRPHSGQDQDGKSRKSQSNSDALQHASSLPRSGSAGAGSGSLLPPLPQSPASQQRRQRHSQHHKARKGQSSGSGSAHGAAHGADRPAAVPGSASAFPWAAPLPLTPTQPQPLTPSQAFPSTPVYAAPVTPSRLGGGPESRSAVEQGEARTPLHSPSPSSPPRQATRRRGLAAGAAGAAGDAATAREQLEKRVGQGDAEPAASDVDTAAPTVSEPFTLGGERGREGNQSGAATSSTSRDQVLPSEAGPSEVSQSVPSSTGDVTQVKQESESSFPNAAPTQAVAAQSQALQPGQRPREGPEEQGQGRALASSAPSHIQHEASGAAPDNATAAALVKMEPMTGETQPATVTKESLTVTTRPVTATAVPGTVKTEPATVKAEPVTREAGAGASPQPGVPLQKQPEAASQPSGVLVVPTTTATVQAPVPVQSPFTTRSHGSRQQQGQERGQPPQTLAAPQGPAPGQAAQGQAQAKGSNDPPPPPPPPPPVRLGYALRFKLWALVEEMHGAFKEDDVTALQALVSPQVGARQAPEPSGSTCGTPASSPAKKQDAAAGGHVSAPGPAATEAASVPVTAGEEKAREAAAIPRADAATTSSSSLTAIPAATAASGAEPGAGAEGPSGAGAGEASEVQAELDRCTAELAALAPLSQARLEAGLRCALPTMQSERRKEDGWKASLVVVSLILAQQREVKRQGRRDRREKEAQAVLAAATAAVAASPRVSHVRRVGGPAGGEGPGPGARMGEWAGAGDTEGGGPLLSSLPCTPHSGSGAPLQSPMSPGGSALTFTFPQRAALEMERDGQSLVAAGGTPLASVDGITGSVLALGTKGGQGKSKRQRGTPGASGLGKGSKRGGAQGQGAGQQPLGKRRKGEAGQGLPSPLSRAGDQPPVCPTCGLQSQAQLAQLGGGGFPDQVPAEGEVPWCTCGGPEQAAGGAPVLRVPVSPAPHESGRCSLCLRRDGTLTEVQADPASTGLPPICLHTACKKALLHFLKTPPQGDGGELPRSAWAVVPTLACAIQEIFRAPLALQLKLRPSVVALFNACLPQTYKYISINSSLL